MVKIPLILTEITAITPLDGRYRKKIEELSLFFSEYALIKTRIEVEVKYILHLSKYKVIRPISKKEKGILEGLFLAFAPNDAKFVKAIENETRHDVKAVEKFIRGKIEKTSLKDLLEYIHFGLTSEDINNVSYRLMLKRGVNHVIIPEFEQVEKALSQIVNNYSGFPMLARTHGQNAVPTTLGKEIAVFASRLHNEFVFLKKQNLCGKLNGAVGNYNALVFVYPKTDWVKFSEEYISNLGLSPNLMTTQINTYEDVTSYLQIMQRINSIFIDFNQDMWRYISDKWFIQKFKKGEVGSSTMPQKVNPIDFENSEGNLGLANALIEFMVRKLPVSRLQRDLTDSTVMRNIGVIMGYELVALKSLLSGLSRVDVNENEIQKALVRDWSILTEGVQTYLRSIGVSDSYVLVATLSKGKIISEKEWTLWIEKLPIEKKHKDCLRKLTPENYIGIAKILAQKTIKK